MIKFYKLKERFCTNIKDSGTLGVYFILVDNKNHVLREYDELLGAFTDISTPPSHKNYFWLDKNVDIEEIDVGATSEERKMVIFQYLLEQ